MTDSQKHSGIAERLVRLRLMTGTLSLTVKHDAAIAQTLGHSPLGRDCNRVRLELTRKGVETALEAARDLFVFLRADSDQLRELVSIIIGCLMAVEHPAADANADLTNVAAFSAMSYEVGRANVLSAIALKLFAYDHKGDLEASQRPSKPPSLSRVIRQ